MFHNEFYPTPDHLVDLMLKPYFEESKRYGTHLCIPNNKNILDPSAGKGNILERVYQHLDQRYKGYSEEESKDLSVIEHKYFNKIEKIQKTNYHSTDKVHARKANNKTGLYGIEVNEELSYILQCKGVNVIGKDFFQYKSDIHDFGLILMNPPFSNGSAHLLKAWEIATETDIVCVLNAETIRNPYNKQRKMLCEIIKNNGGTVEYIGSPFVDSERKTNVECCIVRLQKRQPRNRFSFDFIDDEDLNKDSMVDIDMTSQTTGLETHSYVKNTVRNYQKAKEAYVEYIKALKKLEYYTDGYGLERNVCESVQFNSPNRACRQNKEEENLENFLSDFKHKLLNKVLKDMKVSDYMTSEIYEDLASHIYVHSNMDITEENIRMIIETIMFNYNNNMKKACSTTFDVFTKYHKENREIGEGWKTNKGYKVTNKVILPNFVCFDYGSCYGIDYKKHSTYLDIDKVFCWLSGKKFDEKSETTLYNSVKKVKIGDSSLQDSDFFKFRCYQKGTIHLTFKDPELRDRFNLLVSEHKNIIGWGD